MKRFLIVSLTGAALASGGGVFGAPSAGASNFALGVVQNVERSASAVTVVHEPVAALNWPAMTMQFKVDAALFDRLQPGARIAFEFVGESGAYRIVNAIPLSQSSGAPAVSGGHGGMQGGMHGGMMGQMSDMHEMCMGMMGGGGKRR